MSAIFDKLAFKFHYGLWAIVAFIVIMAGALSAGYQDVAAREVASGLMNVMTLQQLTEIKVNDI